MFKNFLFLFVFFQGIIIAESHTIADDKSSFKGNIVSVIDFGAKGNGKADDGPAIEKALIYCVKNRKICSIPKTANFYNINATIRVPLEPGQSLSIVSNGATIKPLAPPINSSAWNLTAFKEHIFLSVGKQISSYQSTDMFKYRAGSEINISGLVFDGSSFTSQLAPTSLDTDIFVGLQALANVVNLTDCLFKNIYGYGAVVYNVKNSTLMRCKFDDVGGRGATPFVQKVDRDAFGDGVHYSLVKPNGSINIQGCTFQGKKIQNKRSRDAITFEYSSQPYAINISNVNISGFAKCIQIEETAPTVVHINNVNMADFNFGLANVVNNKSAIFLDHVRMDVGLNDGNDSGDALAFLNWQSTAKIYVDNSYLSFNGRKQAYQSAVGLVKVQNSTIDGHQTNFFFADGSTVFSNCTFVGFGGAGVSFLGGPASKYQLIKCNLKNSSSIHSNGQALKLSIE